MRNIASYQEGYTDGYDAGKERAKQSILSMLKCFYNDNYEPTEIADRFTFIKGYNMALDHLSYFIKELEIDSE